MAELALPFAKVHEMEALSARAPAWAKEDRLAALKAYDTTAVESSPLFVRHIIVDGAPVTEVSLAEAPQRGVETVRLDDPQLSGHAQIADGHVTNVALSEAAAEAGVTLTSVAWALDHAPKLAQELLELPSTKQQDKFFHLARALYQDGILLDIPAGVKLDRPIRVDFRQKKPKLATFGRVVVRLQKGARAELHESHASELDAPAVVGITSEVTVGEGAELHYGAIGNFGTGVGVFINRQAAAEARAKVHWSLGNFGGSLTKSHVETRLVGDGSSVKHTEVIFGAHSQKFDISSFATHIGKGARSDLLARAALRHKSRGNVKGMITIDNRGINADSYLGQYALLLDPEAKSVAIPGLEIELQVFYLRSRGIPEQTARRLIVEGFLHPVIAGIGSAALQEEVRALIASKWE
jgi:Fe-S cluster assembly scaffold protein SufB